MYAYKLIEKEKFIYYNFTKDICSVVKKKSAQNEMHNS